MFVMNFQNWDTELAHKNLESLSDGHFLKKIILSDQLYTYTLT